MPRLLLEWGTAPRRRPHRPPEHTPNGSGLRRTPLQQCLLLEWGPCMHGPRGAFPRPRGTFPRPWGTFPRPRGTLPRPRGALPRPGGLSRAPGGLARAPGGLSRAPGGLSRAPGGLSRAPGVLSRAPGGLSRAPGGLSRARGGLTLLLLYFANGRLTKFFWVGAVGDKIALAQRNFVKCPSPPGKFSQGALDRIEIAQGHPESECRVVP